MMLQLDAESAKLLAGFINNPAIFEALSDYAAYKMDYLRDQFYTIEPENAGKIGQLQGQIMELKALTTLHQDLRAILKGPN